MLITLATFGADNLISRSQAVRAVSTFGEAKEVVLDFTGVDFIGQGFADEIFRVYQAANPDIKIGWVNAGPNVRGMIARVQSAS